MGKCRLCNSSNLIEWLDLGMQPHSDHFISEPRDLQTYPLAVCVCNGCGFNQLSHVVAKEDLYLVDYLYESSITKQAQEHWEEFADDVSKKNGLQNNVLDIGSNDGTLLSKFKKLGCTVQGFDPTPQATGIAIKNGIPTIQKFFNFKNAKENVAEKSIDIVLGTNVFAHIDNLYDFMYGVDYILSEKGVFVFESPYFGEFLKGVEFDTVYHQHLSYISLMPLVSFFRKFNMEIFDVEMRPLHGGVARVYISRRGLKDISLNAYSVIGGETWLMNDLKAFSDRTKKFKQRFYDHIKKLYNDGKKIAIVSTPAKGNTLLNYTGIGKFISFATDKSTLKQGRFTPGTNIKIYPDDHLIFGSADVGIVLAWNFFDEIERNVRANGFKGELINPNNFK